MNRQLLFVSFICLMYIHKASAQQVLSVRDKLGYSNSYGSGSHVANTFSNKDTLGVTLYAKGSSNALTEPEAKRGEFIVKFKQGIPSASQSKQSGFNAKPFKDPALFDKLRSDLNLLHSARTKGSKNTSTVSSLEKEYSKAFFGAHIRVSEELVEEIQKLDYVESVHPNGVVKAFLDTSVPLVRAPEVWDTYDTRGEGIVVGIIDTGIDYNHPALGGGFGPDFKVVGGYDFVNDDNDPFDDNEHGTHVAGIVAANGGGLVGVAPEAKLVALKVLNQYGFGYDDDILDAIEWAVDPNGDGDYSDRLDVVNMSLGGPGDYQSPTAIAVNAAVEMGIVFCVAAGNSGGFKTIGSPGTAERAITVGASDDNDMLAYFSSKGPNAGNYAIKPDLLAPGVNITSSVPGGGTANFNGTSMATPHVAGVAALLRDIHPDWTVDQVKAALTTTAKDLGLEVMQQGSGRLDAVKAAGVSCTAYPTQLSYGLNATDQANWGGSRTVTVTNNSVSDQSYSITVTGTQAGVTLTPTETAFTLSSGQSTTVGFSLAVDNNVFEQEPKASQSTGGRVTIAGEEDMLVIPWAFVSGTIVRIAFEDNQLNRDYNKLIQLFNDDFSYGANDASFSEDGLTATFLVPNATYNAFFLFEDWSKIALKENIVVDGSTAISITSADVENKITFAASDENGESLAGRYQGTLTLLIQSKSSRFGNIVSYGTALRELNFSDFSSEYFAITNYTFDVRNEAGNKLYNIELGAFDGLSESVDIQRNPQDLYHFGLDFDLPGPSAVHDITFFVNAHWFDDYGGGGNTVGFGWNWGSSLNLPVDIWHADAYITESSVINNWGLGLDAHVSKNVNDSYHSLRTKLLRVFDDKIVSFDGKWPLSDTPGMNVGQTINFGGGVLHPGTYLNNYDIRSSAFLGSFGEETYFLYDQMNVKVSANDLVLFNGTGRDFFSDWGFYQAGQYQFDFTVPHEQMPGQEGIIKYTTNSIVQNEGGSVMSPFMPGFYFQDKSGELTNQFEKVLDGKVRFSVRPGFSSLVSSQLYIKKSGSDDYETVPVEFVTTENLDGRKVFEGSVFNKPSADTYYDIKLVAKGASGDSMQYVMTSALFVKANKIPEVVNQQPVTIFRGASHEISLDDLIILDDDSNASEMSLIVENGDNYAFDGKKILAPVDFVGTIKVPVTVSDGYDSSAPFLLNIKVVNQPPVITGQVAVEIAKNSSYTLSFSDITATDADDIYPTKHTLLVLPGEHYVVEGMTVFPDETYGGKLQVNIVVDDGFSNSAVYKFEIQVTNEPPLITGQKVTSIWKSASREVGVDDLIVEDSDNHYPDGFVVKVLAVSSGQLEGNVVTPPNDFKGILTASVVVNDGADDSNIFELKIEVMNVAPSIVGQQPKQVTKNNSFSVSIDDLQIIDENDGPDFAYQLSIGQGEDFSSTEDGMIRPVAGFVGTIVIPLTVSDGVDNSPVFEFAVDIVNHKPIITGQVATTLGKNTPIGIDLGLLTVTDADDPLDSLTLKLVEGNGYQIVEGKIQPSANFVGVLKINVTVTDGIDDSDLFEFSVNLSNDVPQIIGQQELSIDKNTSLKILPQYVFVDDDDDEFPTNHSLKIGVGENYSISGQTVTPALDYIGELEVPVVVSDPNSTSLAYNLIIMVNAISGIQDSLSQFIDVYPVPVNDYLNIRFKNQISGQIMLSIVDLVGQTLTEDNLENVQPNSEYALATSHIRPGVYLLLVSTSSGDSFSTRIVKD